MVLDGLYSPSMSDELFDPGHEMMVRSSVNRWYREQPNKAAESCRRSWTSCNMPSRILCRCWNSSMTCHHHPFRFLPLKHRPPPYLKLYLLRHLLNLFSPLCRSEQLQARQRGGALPLRRELAPIQLPPLRQAAQRAASRPTRRRGTRWRRGAGAAF